MERDTGNETQRQTVRDGEGREKTQNFITQGLRLQAVLYSYNQFLLIYMPVSYVLNNSNDTDYHNKYDGQNLDSETISLNQFGPTLHPVLSTLQTHKYQMN